MTSDNLALQRIRASRQGSKHNLGLERKLAATKSWLRVEVDGRSVLMGPKQAKRLEVEMERRMQDLEQFVRDLAPILAQINAALRQLEARVTVLENQPDPPGPPPT